MGRIQRRKANVSKNKQYRKARGTKHRTKDVDQIIEELKCDNVDKIKDFEPDLDLPGCGQFYCVHCAKYFITQNAINTHFKSKEHKKRVKTCRDKPYSQKEADLCVGLN